MSAKPTVAQHFERRDPRIRAIYDRVIRAASSLGPVHEDPKKTSIHLVRETAFAGVATRKNSLILTLKSATELKSPRVFKSQQLSARRWYVEFRLEEPAEVDLELRGWLAKSYEISG